MGATLNHLELLTLVAIARLGDYAYGVTIAAEIQECTGRSASLAAVYAALARVEQHGLVTPWLSEPRAERGGRRRRHYALTSAGSAIVRQERESALRMWLGVPALRGRR
jgi:PadR family transcriptional regulator, regulatory protein PadR